MPAHLRGKGRLDTLALGPEAWFVWRRTVFPDYLLRRIVTARCAGVDADIAGRRGGRRPRHRPADRCSADFSGGINITICPATSSSKSIARRWRIRSKRAARCLITVSSNSRRSSRRGGTVRRRRRKRCSNAWSRDGCPAETLARPKRGFGVPLRRWFGEGLVVWAREILLDSRTARARLDRPRARWRACCGSTRSARAITRSGSGRWCASNCGRAGTLTRAAASRRARNDARPVPRDDARRRRDASSRLGARTDRALGVDVDIITGRPLLFGGPRYAIDRSCPSRFCDRPTRATSSIAGSGAAGSAV